MEDLKKRIQRKQKELKKYSDDEIRRMHLEIYDVEDTSTEEIDAVLAVALRNEVQRRWQAVSWIWKRRSHSEDYEKWISHNRQSEIKATKYAIKKLSYSNDPKSQILFLKFSIINLISGL